jgi:molybdopterin-guanine dinucleotide biosynthesis protein A
MINTKADCSGVILAGGLNTRFSGKDKAFIHIGQKRILDRIFDLFGGLFEEIILVTNDPLKYLAWDLKITTDIFPIRSSLTGIHAGLFFSTYPYAFFTACDAPFLKKELVETIIGHIEPGVDVVIPETTEGLEPLCAVYSKNCLKPVEQNLSHQKLKIQQFFKRARVKRIPEKDLRNDDPKLISFFNINTPADLDWAKRFEAGALKDIQT